MKMLSHFSIFYSFYIRIIKLITLWLDIAVTEFVKITINLMLHVLADGVNNKI